MEVQIPRPFDLFVFLNMAWGGQALYTATRLGVPDLLAGGSKSAGELAQRTGAGERELHQIMRALAGFGIFASDDAGGYRLTPLSEPLVTAAGSWQRNYVLIWGELYYPAAGEMLTMIRSDLTGYELAHGEPPWSHTKIRPETLALFVGFMSSVTDMHNDAVTKAVDFTPWQRVVDVGGGRASLITSVLKANPHLSGTILDLPYMEGEATERIRREGLDARCTFVGGSFLESVPAGGDVYLIKHVLHDWSDAEVPTILRNIGAAMTERSTLIIVEGVVETEDGTGQAVKMQDLERMFLTRGKARSESEFAALLEQAGLRLTEIRLTAVFDCCLIVAVKA
jgi:hypothetical protein